eukprot:13113062-Alexandrium_andersonii.AAC.1
MGEGLDVLRLQVHLPSVPSVSAHQRRDDQRLQPVVGAGFAPGPPGLVVPEVIEAVFEAEGVAHSRG